MLNTEAGTPVEKPARGTGGKSRAWSPYVLAVVFAVVYATYSLVRHLRVESTGYDLGIFDQAIRAYSELRAPVVPVKAPGFNILGDHFHPLLAVIAPFYRLWPDVRTLLIAQAVLVAASLIPIGELAVRRLGRRRGVALLVAYGLSWGIQGAIAFDFHEVALAVPLLAFSLVAVVENRPRAAVLWALPLLLVKEDLGLTVAAIGACLWLRHHRRPGTVLAVCGVVAVPLTCLVIIPHFNPSGVYPYFGIVGSGGSHGGGLPQALLDLPGSIVGHPQKAVLLLFVAGTTAFAALRSSVALVMVPMLAYRLLSSRPLDWSTGPVHYNALLMPILFVALIDAVGSLQASERRAVRRYGRYAIPVTTAIAVVAAPFLSFGRLLTPAFYTPKPEAEAARELARMIPDGARVSASNKLAPQLTDRTYLVLFPNVHHAAVDWAIVKTGRMDDIPVPPATQLAAVAALPSQGFRLVAQRDGILLFHAERR